MTDNLPPILATRLLDDALDAVMIVDAGARIRYTNRAMRELCGYASGELLGQSLNGLLPEAVAARHDGHMRHYVESGKASTVLGKVRSFAIRHRSGAMVPVELKAVDLGVVEGERYFGAFMMDERSRRAAEERSEALRAELKQQALSDPLTGLPNRRAFDAEAAHAMARALRGNAALAVGIADLDLFKHINDAYGHPVGDIVLRAVADTLRHVARASDVVARIGGEEFGLLFPQTTPAQARQIAERIREAVGAAVITTPEGAPIKVTISIGLAALAPDGHLETALSHADAALYEAKRKGRNRTELA